MKAIVISTAYLLVLFCLSKFVFDPSYLYYILPWLDIPMHILGGFGVASLGSAVLTYNKSPATYWKLLGIYAVVAISWEGYEYIHDLLSYREWNGWVDTLKDIFDGALGMSLAYFFLRK